MTVGPAFWFVFGYIVGAIIWWLLRGWDWCYGQP